MSIYKDEVCDTDGCEYQAVEQFDFEGELCDWHVQDAYEEREADMKVKWVKENGFEPVY